MLNEDSMQYIMQFITTSQYSTGLLLWNIFNMIRCFSTSADGFVMRFLCHMYLLLMTKAHINKSIYFENDLNLME